MGHQGKGGNNAAKYGYCNVLSHLHSRQAWFRIVHVFQLVRNVAGAVPLHCAFNFGKPNGLVMLASVVPTRKARSRGHVDYICQSQPVELLACLARCSV